MSMTSGPIVPSYSGKDQLLSPSVNWPDLRLVFASMVVALVADVGCAFAQPLPRDFVLSHPCLHRKMRTPHMVRTVALCKRRNALPAFTNWRMAPGPARGILRCADGVWTLDPNYAAWSRNRARLSALPSTASTSKMPG